MSPPNLCAKCQLEIERTIAVLEGLARVFRSPLGEWLANECDLSDSEARTSSTALWNAFLTWLERNGAATDGWTVTRFGRDLIRRNIIGKKGGRGTIERVGIRLRACASRDNENRVLTGRSRERPAEPAGDFPGGPRRSKSRRSRDPPP